METTLAAIQVQGHSGLDERDDLIKSKGKTIQLGVDVELWHQCCSLAAVRLNHNVRHGTHMEVY